MARYPDWIYRQSAVLPYRWRGDAVEVLLITSRSGQRWVLPKGIVDPGLSAPISAAKEAREEAGIEGAVWDRCVGRYRQRKWGGTCRIEVFPMRVTNEMEDWPEASLRRREWLSLKAARKRVRDEELGAILKGLRKELYARTQGDAEPAPTVIETPRLLYLFRHAKSSWDDPTLADFDRPLAARGRQACEAMSGYLRLADVEPELVLCSSATRTRETLAAIRTAIGEEAQTRFDDGIYHGGPRDLLEQLRGVSDAITTVMLIGHNPAMEELALELAGESNPAERARMAAKYPTAALAILMLEKDSWQSLGPATCHLHSFVVPRQLL